MRVSRWIGTLMLALTASCGSGGGGILGGGTYSPTGLPGPGMPGSGFAGFLNTALPLNWTFLFNDRFGAVGTLNACYSTFLCGHGGFVTQYGNMENAGGRLIFISTSNFTFLDDNNIQRNVTVLASGVARDPFVLTTPNAGRKLRLVFDYAFLASRNVNGDSAAVQLQVGNVVTTVFRVQRSELGAGIPTKAGGCGTFALGVSTTYPTCTDWRRVTVDISQYRGQNLRIRFVVGEVGNDSNQGLAMLIRNPDIEEETP